VGRQSTFRQVLPTQTRVLESYKMKKPVKKQSLEKKLDQIINLLIEINRKLPMSGSGYNHPNYNHYNQGGYTCPRCGQFVLYGQSHYCS
jgi:hypothetical protein